MKKRFTVFLMFIINLLAFAKTFPEELCGIWEGKDRIIFFEEDSKNSDLELIMIFKEYYSWYYDRVAESKNVSEKYERKRNSGTTKNAQRIFVSGKPLNEDLSNVFELRLTYENKESFLLPVCIINQNLFYNFYYKTSVENFFAGVSKTKGIQLYPQLLEENLQALYVMEDKYYEIIYWKTDMEYSEDLVNYTYKDDSFLVPKHLISNGQVYTCLTGKSKNIRHTTAPKVFNKEDFLFSSDNCTFVKKSQGDLVQLADKKTLEDLMKIVQEANKRRKPDPKPLFPPSSAVWHWDIIDELEKNNDIIQQVRKRQLDFGSRGR